MVYEAGSSRLASTQVGGVTSIYAHDAAGNITAMPHLSGGLGWDVDDRLRWSDRGAGSVTAYGYDTGGERVVKVNARRRTVYLPGGADLQQSFGAGGVVTSSTWTLSVGDDAGVLVRFERTVVPGKVPVTLARFALSDLLRSVTVEVDDSGNLLGFEQYTPYGDSCVRVVVSQVEGYSTSRYRFNGKERDVEETGLSYYGARYYACWLGRWVSCDPSVDVRGAAFGFCSGNPTSRVDLDGRLPIDEPMVWRVDHDKVQAGLAERGHNAARSGRTGLAVALGIASALVDLTRPESMAAGLAAAAAIAAAPAVAGAALAVAGTAGVVAGVAELARPGATAFDRARGATNAATSLAAKFVGAGAAARVAAGARSSPRASAAGDVAAEAGSRRGLSGGAKGSSVSPGRSAEVIDGVPQVSEVTSALVDGVADLPSGRSMTSRGAGQAHNAADFLRLKKQLASEQQLGELMSGKGTVMAGRGGRVPIRDEARLIEQYGGKPGDWQKIGSSNYKAPDGTTFETHAYRNSITGQVFEPKTKFQ